MLYNNTTPYALFVPFRFHLYTLNKTSNDAYFSSDPLLEWVLFLPCFRHS